MKKQLLLLLLLCSCSRSPLSVSMSYSRPSTLASVQIGTPDPRKCCPPIGQHLTVHWHRGSGNRSVRLRIRYRDATEDEFWTSINNNSGEMTYSLLNQKYVNKGGIATYSIELYSDGALKEELRHQLWSELIHFDEREIAPHNTSISPADEKLRSDHRPGS